MRKNFSFRKKKSTKKFLFLAILFFLIFIFWDLWQKFFLANSKMVPADGGIFTEATVGKIKNLNPLAENSSDFDRDVQKLIFAGLLKYDPTSGQIVDGLANLRISNDAKKYFLTLKNSARFSDGEKISVDDVLFTFETLLQNPHFPNKNLHDAFEYVTINVVDERTVEFVLPEKNIFFRSFLTTPILPKKYFSDEILLEEIVDPNLPFNKKPVGAGPFFLKNIVPNDDGSARIFLQKNKFFYRGAPKIDKIVFYVFPDFENLNFSSPWTTMFSRIPAAHLEKFEKKFLDEYFRREYILPRWIAIFFNLEKNFTKYRNFRRALFSATDKKKILERERGWTPIDSFFFFENINEFFEKDFSAARKFLRDGGFPFDKKKEIRTFGRDGDPISLKIITSISPPIFSRIAQNLAQSWERELNFPVKTEILDEKNFLLALQNRDFDAAFFGQNFSQNFDAVSMWHSIAGEKFNLSNLKNPDVDFLIDEIRFAGAQSDLFLLNEKINEIAPAVPIATPKYFLLVSKKLQNFSENFGKLRAHADRFFGVENWFFAKKREWNWPENSSKIFGFFKFIFSEK